MRKYLEIMKSQLKLETAYVAWFWADFFAGILKFIILFFFWSAIYQNQTTVQGINFESMITYIVLATILEGYATGIGDDLARDIIQGNLAIEFIRPYQYILKLFSIDIGKKCSGLVRNVLPVILLCVFFLKLRGPDNISTVFLFGVSALLGTLIGALLDMIIGVLAFWTVHMWGLRMLRLAIVRFFSGALIPLILFPQWFQKISMMLPFQSMVYIPVGIFTDTLPKGTSIPLLISMQFGWAVILGLVVALMWRIAVRKVTIFGG